jgi:hypothetical protein
MNMEQIRHRDGSETNEKVVTMAVISLLGSLLVLGVAIWTMWATVAPSFARMVAALSGTASVSTYVNVSAYQRRQRSVRIARVSFSRLALRAAA